MVRQAHHVRLWDSPSPNLDTLSLSKGEMGFVIRPARADDIRELVRLATSLSAHGFLTLPHSLKEMEGLIEKEHLFVLEADGKVVGSSLIIARHGTPDSPHLYFQVDEKKQTLTLRAETTGRTELGGLILDKNLRGHPEKLGKRLSYARLFYIYNHRGQFLKDLVAELLPPFDSDGKSALWEALGRRFTGMDYREADERSRKDKKFVIEKFPKEPIFIKTLPREAREAIGKTGPNTKPVAKILEEVGFRYLNQIDPFDGGPHYGAIQDEMRFNLISDFLLKSTAVRLDLGH